MNHVNKFMAAMAGVLALTLAAAVPAGARADAVSPVPGNLIAQQLEGVGITEHLNESIPLNASFKDEFGRPLTLDSLFHHDKPVILLLVYFQCPYACNQLMNSLQSTMNIMALRPDKDYDIVTISFDPNEGPELAKNKKMTYANQFVPGLRSDGTKAWHFLTGTQNNIAAVANAVGFHYSWDNNDKLFRHATAMFVLTPEGRLSRYIYKTTPVDTETLRLSLIEASQGKIGTTIDHVLLYCFSYDASANAYVRNAMHVMQLGGVLTLLVLACILGPLWYLEHKHKQGVQRQKLAGAMT